jgi:hypothetical protein
MTTTRIRCTLAAGAAAATATALVLTTAAPAGAATTQAALGRCFYPQVCLYPRSQTTQPTGRFRDVTTNWQWLSRSFGTTSAYNTRHDDVAYLLTTTGRTICVPPRSSAGPINGGFTAIRISYRSHC